MDVRSMTYLDLVDYAYARDLEAIAMHAPPGKEGRWPSYLKGTIRADARNTRERANSLLAEILGARGGTIHTHYTWAMGRFVGYPRSLDGRYDRNFMTPAIHHEGTDLRSDGKVNPFDHHRKMNKDRKAFAILSAPYAIPVNLDGAFPAVVGLPLRRSWYGHGTVGLLWVKRESEAWVRDVLGDLVVDRATAVASMIEARTQADAAYAKRKAA